jgi:hypothetical protein
MKYVIFQRTHLEKKHIPNCSTPFHFHSCHKYVSLLLHWMSVQFCVRYNFKLGIRLCWCQRNAETANTLQYGTTTKEFNFK